jgi:hypothetical protein
MLFVVTATQLQHFDDDFSVCCVSVNEYIIGALSLDKYDDDTVTGYTRQRFEGEFTFAVLLLAFVLAIFSLIVNVFLTELWLIF